MALIQDLSRRMDMSNSTSTASILEAQTLDPWTGQWKYPQSLSIFFCAIIALFTIRHILLTHLDKHRLKHRSTPNPNLLHRTTALIRTITYRGRLGPTILLLSCLLLTTTWTFTARPYYRPLRSGGSPPLALRSGMFAVGMIPFVYLLSFKASPLSYLTGVSHEKLNVLHRWGARIMFFMGVVHTIPFLVQPAKEGGAAGLRAEFYSDWINTTGCLAMGALGWLVFASWAPLRRVCYEFFVYSHIIAGILFLAFMFWHCENLLTSWSYLWATVAVWLFSLLLRFAQMNWFTTLPSTVRILPGGAVGVAVPTTLTWAPGQHAFLRFPGLAPFDNHPFSISSVPRESKKGYELNSLEVVIKPYSGFTKRLLSYASANPDAELGVVLDGPYGGVPRAVEAFQTVVLVAGGSGITAVVGVVLRLAALMKGTQVGVCTRRVKLVWVVRDQSEFGWFWREISDAVEGLPEGFVECRFHVTGEGKDFGAAVGGDGIEGVEKGRPDCGRLLEGWIGEGEGEGEGEGSRVCVIVSGPTGLRDNVGNNVSKLQSRVGKNGVEEIYLHKESFDW